MNKLKIFLILIFVSKYIFCKENLFELKEDSSSFLPVDKDIEIIQTDDYILDYLQRAPFDSNTALYDKLEIIPYLEEDEIIKILTEESFMTNNKSCCKASSKKLTGKVDLRVLSDFENINSFYFFNRVKLLYKDKISFGYTFLRKQDEVKLDVDYFKNFFRKWYVQTKIKNTNVVIGNYKANFGTGMVFDRNYPIENLKDIKPQPSGLEEDKTIYDNAYLYGVGLEKLGRNFLFSLFFSNKDLLGVDISTNSFGNFVNEDLIDVRKKEINYTSLKINGVTEWLVGFNLKLLFKKFRIGSCGYYSQYNILFDPDKTNSSGYYLSEKYSEKWKYVFRGDKLFLGSLYCEIPFEKISFFLETAQSYSKNSSVEYQRKDHGINLGMMIKTKRINSYLIYIYLGEYFFSPLGKPILIFNYPSSQTGVKLFNEFKFKKINLRFGAAVCRLLNGIWSGHYLSEQPRYPSNYNEGFVKMTYELKNITLCWYLFCSLSECYINLKNYELNLFDEYIQTTQIKLKNMYKITYKILNSLQLSLCYDQKQRGFPYFDRQLYGEQLFTEVQCKMSKFSCLFKFSTFNVDKGVYLTYLKPQWRDFYIFEYDDFSFGDRFYLSFSYKFMNNFTIWSSYESKNSSSLESSTDNTDNIIKFQIEFIF